MDYNDPAVRTRIGSGAARPAFGAVHPALGAVHPVDPSTLGADGVAHIRRFDASFRR